MTLVSTTYKAAADRVICYDPMLMGQYEVRVTPIPLTPRMPRPR